jgi:hypothetical protein
MRSRLRNLKIDTRRINGEEITETFSASVGPGQIAGKGRINWSRLDGSHWAKVDFRDVDVTEFMQVCDIRFDGRIAARLSGALEVRWQGMRFRQMRATMEGSGSLTISGGSISSTRILDNIARFSGIADLKRVDFEEGAISGSFSGGKILVQGFWLRNPDYRISADGEVGLETGDLDAHFDLAVVPSFGARSEYPEVRAAASVLEGLTRRRDKDGLVPVPLPVSFGGTLEKPQAFFDLGAGDFFDTTRNSVKTLERATRGNSEKGKNGPDGSRK